MKNDHVDATSVAILVPKANGYFTALSFKSYLLSLGIREVNVIDVQPCQLKRVEIPATITTLYIGGLGLKNCSSKDLCAFIKKYQDIIAFWADNHPVHEEIKEMTTSELRCLYFDALDDKAPSCTALLNRLWGDKIVKPDWISAANHLENSAKYPGNVLSEQYKTLLHVAKVEDDSGHTHCYTDEVKALYAKYLLSGGANWTEISRLLKKHGKIKNATLKAQRNIVPLHPEMPGVFVSNPGEAEQVEKEPILEVLNREHEKHLVAVQHHNLRGEPITTIMSKKVNLLAIFAGAQPGAKVANKIYLPGDHEEVLRQITDRLIKTEFKIEKN